MNIFNSKFRKISILFIGLMSLYFFNVVEDVSATVSNDEEDKDKSEKEKEMMNLKIKLNLNNIDHNNLQKIKIVSFVNGEGKEQYVDLVKEKSKIKNNILVVNLQFAKSNDVSSIIATDQYFVCGYALNNNIKNQTAISNNEIFPL